jgi:hypothetical protein
MRLPIIDDEPHIGQMMRLTLEAARYEVAAAVARLTRRATKPERRSGVCRPSACCRPTSGVKAGRYFDR